MSFTLGAAQPLFPSLLPRQADPLWHEVDIPKDEDAELSKAEKEFELWMKSYTKRVNQLQQPPIGTQSQEAEEEEMEEEEDDDDHDNEEDSDSRVDEDDVEMDINFGQESPVVAS